MQRVATELYEAMGALDNLSLDGQLLYSSWDWVHYRVPGFLASSYRKLRRLATSQAVDVVLFSSMVTAALAVPLRKVFQTNGITTAAIVHGQDVTTPFGPYQKFVPKVFNAVDAILPVSKATGDQCLLRGLPASKLRVVPNGVKLERFEALAPHPTMRQEMFASLGRSLPENALLLCTVGRQVKRKGFAWFIDQVMPRLPEHVHFWLAGDGPEENAITEAARHHGLQDRVVRLGRITDAQLSHLLRGADLFMMPNIPVPGTMEGFGVVMLEAGLCGLPAVAARLEGIQDVITEGINGHLVESGDADAFAGHNQRYEADRLTLRALSESAYQHTKHTFGWPSVAQQYVDTLADIRAGN